MCVCRADLDPIYFCELIDVCDVKDDGDAKITSLKVPAIVNYGRSCDLAAAVIYVCLYR